MKDYTDSDFDVPEGVAASCANIRRMAFGGSAHWPLTGLAVFSRMIWGLEKLCRCLRLSHSRK